MFRAFELKINETDIQRLIDVPIEEFISIGKKDYEESRTKLKCELSKFVQNEVIDGIGISNDIFPVLHKDVFLSHSHDDRQLAYIVAKMLNQWFGLDVFVDSMFWGSADELLWEVDNKYCRKNENTYDYNKRNLSSSHVHAMLSTAIMKAMDQSEIIIFLNTPNSVPEIKSTMEEEYTLSPWIYEEVLLSSMLREINWRVSKKDSNLFESKMEHTNQSFKIAYKLPKENLIQLSLQDIKAWKKKYEESCEKNILTMQLDEDTHSLDILYKIKCCI